MVSDAREAEGQRDRAAIDDPRHVGQLGRLVEHGACHAEARRVDGGLALGLPREELADHGHEPVELRGRERLDRHRRRAVRRPREEPEQRLGPADVSR